MASRDDVANKIFGLVHKPLSGPYVCRKEHDAMISSYAQIPG